MTVESDSSFPLKCKSCTNEARDILHHSVCLSGYKCVCLVHCVLSATVEADGSYVCLAWVTRHIYYSSSTQKKCFVLRPNIKHTHTHMLVTSYVCTETTQAHTPAQTQLMERPCKQQHFTYRQMTADTYKDKWGRPKPALQQQWLSRLLR